MLLEKYSVFAVENALQKNQIILSVYLVSQYLYLRGYVQFFKKT